MKIYVNNRENIKKKLNSNINNNYLYFFCKQVEIIENMPYNKKNSKLSRWKVEKYSINYRYNTKVFVKVRKR